MDATDRDTALERVAIEDVWGVGRRYGETLRRAGLTTAKALRDADDQRLNRIINNVTLARTVFELRGKPCLDLELEPPPRKGIMTSRSFGQPLYRLSELREAVACYTSRASFKLRQQGLVDRGLRCSFRPTGFERGSLS